MEFQTLEIAEKSIMLRKDTWTHVKIPPVMIMYNTHYNEIQIYDCKLSLNLKFN